MPDASDFFKELKCYRFRIFSLTKRFSGVSHGGYYLKSWVASTETLMKGLKKPVGTVGRSEYICIKRLERDKVCEEGARKRM